MSLRGYLVTMAAGTLVAVFGIGILFLNIRPEEAGFQEFLLLYLLCFLALVGFFSLVGLCVRTRVFTRREFLAREVQKAFRQALLLAGVAVGAFILLKHTTFHWWTSFVLMFIASAIEIATLLIQRSRRG